MDQHDANAPALQYNAVLAPFFTEQTPCEDAELIIAHPLGSKRASSMLDARTTAMLALVDKYNRVRYSDYLLHLFKAQLLASIYLPFGCDFCVNRAIIYASRNTVARVMQRLWIAATYVMRLALRLAVFPTAVIGLYILYDEMYDYWDFHDFPAIGLCIWMQLRFFCITAIAFGLTYALRKFVRRNTRWSYPPTTPVECKPRPLPPAPVAGNPLRHQRFVQDATSFTALIQWINECIASQYNLAAMLCADRAPSPSQIDISTSATLDLVYLNLQALSNITRWYALMVWSWPVYQFVSSDWTAEIAAAIYLFTYRNCNLTSYLNARLVLFSNGDVYAAQVFATGNGDYVSAYFGLVWNITWKRALIRPWLRDPLRTDNVENSRLWHLARIVTVAFVVYRTSTYACDEWNKATKGLVAVILQVAFRLQMEIIRTPIVLCAIAVPANLLRFQIWHLLKWIFSTTERNVCPVQ